LLATGLKAAGHEVVVHTFYSQGDFEPDLASAGVSISSIGKTGRWEILGFFRRALRVIRAERSEIVLAYLGGANIVSSLLKPWLRPAKIVWGVRGARTSFQRFDWVVSTNLWLESLLSKTADLIIANSDFARQSAVQAGFPPDGVVVVPNGIDLSQFFIDAAGRSRIRAEWGLAEGDIAVGRAGRLHGDKDYPGFLQAAAIAARHDPRFKFVCIGAGPESVLTQLKTVAKDLGISDRVLWTGGIRNMREAYGALDLFVSSSKTESFPNVLLEAMACGVPCVSTDVGAARDIISDLGVVVPPCDSEKLAEAILRLARSSPDPEVLRASIAARFSIELLVERTESLLRKLLQSQGRSHVEVSPKVASA